MLIGADGVKSVVRAQMFGAAPATYTGDSVGRRPRTRYTITAKGRRALAAWLSQPGDGPILECEQLLKIHLADAGTKADIVTNIEATRAWVLAQNQENLATARA